ncbi:MAG TPA: hypothetical protein VL426_05165 [Candidatus Binatia bacterium]|nr:hypothetical protein [Candidatus Binatia bacterium]
MEPIVIEPARASRVAEQVLAAFHEVRELADQKPHEGQFDRIRGLLQASLAVLEEVRAMSPYRSDGKETSISRAAIVMAMDGEIPRLAELKVALGIQSARGGDLPVEPIRVFVSAAVVARSILVCPPLAPRKEVSGDDESDPAAAFHG